MGEAWQLPIIDCLGFLALCPFAQPTKGVGAAGLTCANSDTSTTLPSSSDTLSSLPHHLPSPSVNTFNMNVFHTPFH